MPLGISRPYMRGQEISRFPARTRCPLIGVARHRPPRRFLAPQVRGSCLLLTPFHPRGGCPRLKAPGVMGHTCPDLSCGCLQRPPRLRPRLWSQRVGTSLCSVEVVPRASKRIFAHRAAGQRRGQRFVVRGLRPLRRENSCLFADRHSAPSAYSCRGRTDMRGEPALLPLQCFPAGA